MTGYSLHIGLNRIDPKHYGDDGALAGCVNDASAMAEIMRAQGFDPIVLHDDWATAAAVIQTLRDLAKRVGPGQTLPLTYAGHGSQVPDRDGDERTDKLDETWCLFDRMLLDDELWRLFRLFPAGSRIVMVSDSCHSGTMARMLARTGAIQTFDQVPDAMTDLGEVLTGNKRFDLSRTRLLDPSLSRDVYREHADLYRSLQTGDRAEAEDDCKAEIVTLSGCRDDQTSLDGEDHGLMTEGLLTAWGDGSEGATLSRFHREIREHCWPYQTPELRFYGAAALPKRKRELLGRKLWTLEG